jgi:AmmeMemoRadiSam system protein A
MIDRVKDRGMTDADLALTYADALNGIAARAIRQGIDGLSPGSFATANYPPALQILRATFVTLEMNGDLRGCVGGLEARQPLAADVATHAFGAAFHDTRFAPVDARAWPNLTVSISILSPRESLAAASQIEALGALRPGMDGLVLSEGSRRSVFLPKVWEDVPDPVQFLALLKRKAGLPESHWSPALTLERFTATAVPPARLAAIPA